MSRIQAPRIPNFTMAKCRGHDMNMWFPNIGKGMAKPAREAKQLCKSCQVQVDCLRYGKETHSSGIWGGYALKSDRINKSREAIGETL